MSFEKIQERIIKACELSGRRSEEVTLVAITKNRSIAEIEDKVLRFGHGILGESRIQEWLDKKNKLPNIQWHMVGNLQTNKVKYCEDFHFIHSLNSFRLADEMQKQGLKLSHCFKVFVEVNVVGEISKHGIAFEKARELVSYAQSLDQLEVHGLMTIAPYTNDKETLRKVFKNLKQLCDKLSLRELSMGMSNDFEIAIEEGATFVRIGSALFEN